MVLSDISIIPNSGILDTIFHQTYADIKILGQPAHPYHLTLIGLILLIIIALAANWVTEQLTGRKAGRLFLATIITIIGAILVQAFVLLGSWDIAIEGVHIVAALLGSIVIAVFYTLLSGRVSGNKGGH